MKIKTDKKIAIHTPTKEIWDAVQENITRVYSWSSSGCGEDSCIDLCDGCYGDKKYYIEHDYKIITLEEYNKYGIKGRPKDTVINNYEIF